MNEEVKLKSDWDEFVEFIENNVKEYQDKLAKEQASTSPRKPSD